MNISENAWKKEKNRNNPKKIWQDTKHALSPDKYLV